MQWAFINLLVAVTAIQGAYNKCLVSACVVFSLLILSLCLFLEVKLSGLWSFVLGTMLYALPCIAAYSSAFTKKRAAMAICSALLMLLEVLAAYLWLVDSYAIVGAYYRPIALALYSFLAVVCFWNSNGTLCKFAASLGNRHKGFSSNN